MEISLQPKQSEALDKSFLIPVVFYGGAKGGGKSYFVRAKQVYRRLKYPNTKGLIVRKTYPELLSNHIRQFFVEYPQTLDWYKSSEKAIYWPNGSITEFSHLGSLMDVYTYQGREYEDIDIDEATQHEEMVFKILRSSNRTSNKEFTKSGGKVSFGLTGNPGGVGHGWVKRLFIDKQFTENENPDDFGFVQAKVWDNKALMDADPSYVKRLKDLPKDLQRAYLEGDWDVFAGQVFSEWRRELHVCNPVVPRSIYPHFLWIDWGYSGSESHEGAFACLAGALVQENFEGVVFNRIIVYKEWYGKYKDPKEWARVIYESSPVKNYKEGVADSAMFNTQTDGSTDIAKLMEDEWDKLSKRHFLTLKKGIKNRLSRVATLHNWLSIAPDGLPYMLITESCPHTIRTVPLLVYDPYNVEDVDCFVKGTKVSTPKGIVNVEDIKLGDLVDTPIGPRKVVKAGISGNSGRVIEVSLSNGEKLKGTANHCVYVRGKGLVELQKLKVGNILIDKTISNIILIWQLKQLFIKILHLGKAMVGIITDLTEQVLRKVSKSCIGKYIKITLGKFLKVLTYITKTITATIIAQRIWKQYLKLTTQGITINLIMKIRRLKKKPIFGISQKKERRNLKRTQEKCLRTHQKEQYRAEIVELLLKLDILQGFTAQNNANLKKNRVKNVLYVVKKKLGKTPPVHISAVGNYEEEIVYKLTIDEAHLYYANGVLVTNTTGEDHCYDALTYGLSDVRFINAKLGVMAQPDKKKGLPEFINELDLSAFEKATKVKSKDWRNI